MKTRLFTFCRLLQLTVGFVWLMVAATVHAFPPAPHHIIYGLVRDEMGGALSMTNATIILETLSGSQIKSSIVPNLEPGVNYNLLIPMDSGLTSDAYKPTALKPTTPFRIKVQIGGTTYLPIEMTGNYSSLGQPAKTTRIDLTLGEDSDGDGIPDAWERTLISLLGGTLAGITPSGDADGDGLSNYAEYIAGTYAFDPADGFTLKIIGFDQGKPLCEFLAIRNHTYTVYGSSDLNTWTEMTFSIPAEGSTAVLRRYYRAPDARIVRIAIETPSDVPQFFKVLVR